MTKKYTYNAVFKEHGEVFGLAYEELVQAFLDGRQYPLGNILSLAGHFTDCTDAINIIDQARAHADQEIAEAEQFKDDSMIKQHIKRAIKECWPVKLKTNGVWDSCHCLLSNFTGNTVEAHYSSAMSITVDVSDINAIKDSVHTDYTAHLEVAASQIYG